MKLKKLLPILFVLFSFSFSAKANYMLIQNVTKVGNNPTNKTILIQFDISWQNSWRDSINWDAAWVFIKFKDANGLWQHARLNLGGYVNGAGTSNTIKVGSDSVGAFVYRDVLGSGNFNATSMQLQWNYGASGLTDVSALEVRVFATEMVYVPQGDFNAAGSVYQNNLTSYGSYYIFYNTSSRTNGQFVAPGNNFPVINTRLSPTLTHKDSTAVINMRIKGDAGIDFNNDGVVDNTTYPTGYKAFYCYKYEMTTQQYADFLNTLTATQIINLGTGDSLITVNNGQYFSSSPNRACGYSNANRLFAYADWSGLRPISFLEFNKASYGPIQPIFNTASLNLTYSAWGSNTALNLAPYNGNTANCTLKDVGYLDSTNSTRASSGASYYGIMDLTGNATEPIVKLSNSSFSTLSGDGVLASNGNSNIVNWVTNLIIFIDQARNSNSCSPVTKYFGFRYVRSAE